MHSLVLVIGESIHEQMAPFADYQQVEPYLVYVDDVKGMAEHYDLPEDDLEGLAAKMPDWNETEGVVQGGRLAFWSRENPEGKFDFYKVGGRFAGYFRLRQPRPASFLGRLLGKGPSERVDSAKKSEIVSEEVKANPPFAILANGAWVEQGWGEIAPSEEEWQRQFSRRFDLLSDDDLMTVVDIHS